MDDNEMGTVTDPQPVVRVVQEPTADELQLELAQAVALKMAAGWQRVESQGPLSVVLVKGKPVNHIFHLLMSVVTAGIWAFTVWPFLTFFRGEKRLVLSIDPFGYVHEQEV